MGMKLDLFWDGRGYHVSWCEDGEEGGEVGQSHSDTGPGLPERLKEAKQRRSFEDFEYLFVEIAAHDWVAKHRPLFPVPPSSYRGYCFSAEQAKQAKEFAIAMRAAAKIAKSEFDADVPWPEWAKQATAAGWKPPKGWKP